MSITFGKLSGMWNSPLFDPPVFHLSKELFFFTEPVYIFALPDPGGELQSLTNELYQCEAISHMTDNQAVFFFFVSERH